MKLCGLLLLAGLTLSGCITVYTPERQCRDEKTGRFISCP